MVPAARAGRLPEPLTLGTSLLGGCRHPSPHVLLHLPPAGVKARAQRQESGPLRTQFLGGFLKCSGPGTSGPEMAGGRWAGGGWIPPGETPEAGGRQVMQVRSSQGHRRHRAGLLVSSFPQPVSPLSVT